jgi:hypothetical protein
MDLKEILEAVAWTDLAQDRGQRRVLNKPSGSTICGETHERMAASEGLSSMELHVIQVHVLIHVEILSYYHVYMNTIYNFTCIYNKCRGTR